MARIEDELRGATVSMNRWRNNIKDDGPSGAARALHLHRCAEAAAHEIDRLRAALAELHALVWGESPSLLNEDSGGDARLDAEIRSLID